MSLKYTCPSCGTPLGYEGLCWKCKCEQERQAALAWMPEQIVEKQRNLIQNIQRLADMEDPEFADFWQLLGYHDAITPEIQRVALAAEVFWPCEIYYHAPADVRDGLIHALLPKSFAKIKLIGFSSFVHSVVFWANPLIAANATHSVINVFLIEIIIVCFLFSAKFDTESEKNMNFLMR